MKKGIQKQGGTGSQNGYTPKENPNPSRPPSSGPNVTKPSK